MTQQTFSVKNTQCTKLRSEYNT